MTDKDPTSHGEAAPGDVIAGVTLEKKLFSDTLRSVWSGRSPEGDARAVAVLAPGRSEQEASLFGEAARKLGELRRARRHSAIVRVHAVSKDGRACVTDLWTVGTLADLPALGWDLEARLRLMRQVCVGLGALHEAGLVHGCLRPTCVLMDDGLSPVISEAGMFDIALSCEGNLDGAYGYLPYASPEARCGMPLDARADVFSAGCLLHFLLICRDPPALGADAVPPLESIRTYAPAGLVRIVRKCVLLDAKQRYASMQELVRDLDRYGEHDKVGTAHFDAKETNYTLSLPLPGRRRPPSAVPPVAPAAPPGRPRPSSPVPPVASAPPPGRRRPPSAVPPAASARPAPRTDAVRSSPFGLEGPPLLWVALGGLVLCLYCTLHAYVAASPNLLLRLGMSVGAGAATLALSLAVPRASIARAAIAAIVLVTVFLLDLSGTLGLDAARERIRSKDPVTAVKALRTLRTAGESNCINAQLRGADLPGIDLSGVRLDASDLSGANLSGANLTDASLAHARIDGADLGGAVVANVKGLEQAHCTTATRMPDGWECTGSQPTPKGH